MAADKQPSRYNEVERKFSVVETTVSPSFEGLSTIGRVERLPVQHLDAVYFDTPAHDLAAHRITLRRRTGGPDAGWHLKLPGDGFRTEVTEPLTDETTPPAALAIWTCNRDASVTIQRCNVNGYSSERFLQFLKSGVELFPGPRSSGWVAEVESTWKLYAKYTRNNSPIP